MCKPLDDFETLKWARRGLMADRTYIGKREIENRDTFFFRLETSENGKKKSKKRRSQKGQGPLTVVAKI